MTTKSRSLSLLSQGLIFLTLFSACSSNNSDKKTVQQVTVAPVAQELALTPPMGWNSWNPYGANVSEQVIKETADAFISTGLKDAGFNYIVIDDIWQGGRDSVTGLLYPDAKRFPSGMKAVADYVHSKGLKFGIYSDAGTQTCGGKPGSFSYEEKDAKLFAEWGADYVKYDYCYCNDYASLNNDYLMARSRYKTMGDALKSTGRPIVFSICEWGARGPWLWGKEVGGNLWRTTEDVGDKWDSPRNEESHNWDDSHIGILASIDKNINLSRFAGPGGWNDPDMLVIGLKNSGYVKGGGCSPEEYRSQMSMWCMMASPLMMGCDVRNMSDATKSVLLNKDIIAIDQDTLGKQALRVYRLDGIEAFNKRLSGNRVAIAFMNRNTKPGKITLSYKDLELDKNIKYSVYDVWKHSGVTPPAGTLSAEMKSHECQVFVLTPQ